jgi:hypothetical protein
LYTLSFEADEENLLFTSSDLFNWFFLLDVAFIGYFSKLPTFYVFVCWFFYPFLPILFIAPNPIVLFNLSLQLSHEFNEDKALTMNFAFLLLRFNLYKKYNWLYFILNFRIVEIYLETTLWKLPLFLYRLSLRNPCYNLVLIFFFNNSMSINGDLTFYFILRSVCNVLTTVVSFYTFSNLDIFIRVPSFLSGVKFILVYNNIICQ